MTPLELEFAALEAMNGPALHARWIAVTGSVVPRISPQLLRVTLAWEIRAKNGRRCERQRGAHA